MTARRDPVKVLVAAVSIVVAMTSCGAVGGINVDSNLTENIAQARLIALVTDTLRALPAATSLGIHNPTPGRPTSAGSIIAPCDDNDQGGKGPVNLPFARWVRNSQPAQVNTDLDATAAAGRATGLTVQDDKAPTLRFVRLRTSDGSLLDGVEYPTCAVWLFGGVLVGLGVQQHPCLPLRHMRPVGAPATVATHLPRHRRRNTPDPGPDLAVLQDFSYTAGDLLPISHTPLDARRDPSPPSQDQLLRPPEPAYRCGGHGKTD